MHDFANKLQLKQPCPKCGLDLAELRVCPNDGTTLGGDGDPQAGDLFQDKYVVLSRIASGGMGVVLKAKQHGLERFVAIKMMHATNMSDQAVRRFQQEARAMSNLHHTNLVAVHDIGLTQYGQPYMVMDYVEGTTLATLLEQRTRLTLDESLDIITQVCEGLAHVHANKVLHRDLKPSNIMLVPNQTGGYTVKLVDFGIAKVVDDTIGKSITQTGEVFGSPAYMSPEQARGTGTDERSDIYALGCVIYEMLTGIQPFAGANVLETIVKQMEQKQKPLNKALPSGQCPNLLETIVEKCLQKNPEERYQSVSDLRSDLAKLKGGNAAYSVKLPEFSGKSKSSAALLATVVVALGALLVFLWNLLTTETKLPEVKESHRLEFTNEEGLDKALHQQLANGNQDNFSAEGAITTVKNADLKWLKERPKNLQRLSLSGVSDLSDDSAQYIKDMPLQFLDLSDTPIRDSFVEKLAGTKSIINLHLDRTKVSEAAVEVVSRFPGLVELGLSETFISDPALRTLGQNAKMLMVLDISGTIVSDAGVEETIKNNLALWKLNLANTNIHDSALEHLAGLKLLRELNLSRDSAVTDHVLPEISKLNYLENIVLDGTAITDHGLEKFTPPPNLKQLSVIDCPHITEKAVLEFKRKHPTIPVRFDIRAR